MMEMNYNNFKHVVGNFNSNYLYPSPGVNFNENPNIIKFGLPDTNYIDGFFMPDFLDVLAVFHDKKPCALVGPISIGKIIDLKTKGLYVQNTKVWGSDEIQFFISKNEKLCKYMGCMFTHYVIRNQASNIFHVKMGLGLGYNHKTIKTFLHRIRAYD